MNRFLLKSQENNSFYRKAHIYFPKHKSKFVLLGKITFSLSFLIFYAMITGAIFEDNSGNIFVFKYTHLYFIGMLVFILNMQPPIIDKRFFANYFLYKREKFDRLFYCFNLVFVYLIKLSILPLILVNLLFSYVYYPTNFYINFSLYLSIGLLSIIITSIIYSVLIFFTKSEKLVGFSLCLLPLSIVFLINEINLITYFLFLLGLVIIYIILLLVIINTKNDTIYKANS